MLSVAALWTGGPLPPYGPACLKSFVAHGHPLTLFTYAKIDGVPAGIAVEDANAILPERICADFARVRKFAQFANYFRYRLLQARPGTCWVDTDLYCLRPLAAEEHIFGWQEPGLINNAVLALPPDSSALALLVAMFEDADFVPGWIGRRAAAYRILARTGLPVSKARYPWGVLGPVALTHYLKSAGLDAFAKPVAHFYPLHWRETERLFDPTCDWGDVLRGATTIHLWNEVLRRRAGGNTPPAGSLLWRVLQGTLRV